MATKVDKAPAEADKSQEAKDKATSAQMDAVLDKLLPPKQPQTSPPTVEPSPAKTVSQEEYDKTVNELKMWQGRVKPIEDLQKQINTLTSQIQSKDEELKDISEERDKVQEMIDELSKDDPGKIALVRLDRELRDKEKQLKADMKAHTDEWTSKQARVEASEATIREIAIFNIAGEYEGGDPIKLKALSEQAKAGSEEDYRKLADTVWQKKIGTPSNPTPPDTPMHIDSSKTTGDTGKVSRQSLADYSPQGKQGSDFAKDQEEILDKFFGKSTK